MLAFYLVELLITQTWGCDFDYHLDDASILNSKWFIQWMCMPTCIHLFYFQNIERLSPQSSWWLNNQLALREKQHKIEESYYFIVFASLTTRDGITGHAKNIIIVAHKLMLWLVIIFHNICILHVEEDTKEYNAFLVLNFFPHDNFIFSFTEHSCISHNLLA